MSRFQRTHPALLLALLCAVGSPLVAIEPLTLRLSDVEGAPGDLVTVVLRTYSPRSLGQGQICFRANPATGATGSPGVVGATEPFSALESVVVFSTAGDAQVSGDLPAADMAMLDFLSPSGSVNRLDGPLAVFTLRLAATLQPGDAYALELDMPNTVLLGPNGESVVIEPRGGTLHVVAPGAPRSLEAEGDRVPPGAMATLGVETLAPFPIGSASLIVSWAAGFTIGTPVVRIDPRYGNASWRVDTSIPNQVEIAVTSADGSLNTISGAIIEILVQTDPLAPDGSGAVQVESGAQFFDPQSQPISLAIGADELEIDGAGAIFHDSFEAGSTVYWSAVAP